MAPQENINLKVYIDGVQSLNPITDGITFTSSNTAVATVSTNGTITAVAAGNAVITVAKGNSTVTINVAVQ